MNRAVLFVLAVVASAECFAPVLPPKLPKAVGQRQTSRPAVLSMHAHSGTPVSRRGLVASLPFLLSLAQAAQAKDQEGVPFDGAYTDPKHPGCPRNIAMMVDRDGKNAAEGAVEVTGKDGTPGCSGDGPTKAWRLAGKVKGDQIFVDFSPKGGPKDLLGKWEQDGIRWPDSNKWSKVSGKLPDL